jgi:glutamyl-tRNA synthetase
VTQMTSIVRFAPSPTGRIHIGNARTAILNWLMRLKTNGQFILRYDDTDVERSTQEFAEAILEDLLWLGIKPDRIEHQSKRFDRYAAAADQLESEGRKPHWRFKLDHRSVVWDDLIRGPQHIDTASLSDPVLVREDGSYLYTLPSVVDDIEFGVSHVIRGEDHVVNTAVQIEIFEALTGSAPRFGHHSLLIGADGKGLSKRLGSMSIARLRESGLEPMAVVSHAALLGTSDAIAPHRHMATLVDGFDLGKRPN